ncbi:hypothetical protein NIES267_73770 (plasmid) [Calothrix parasitica NIES-267]|uniref:Uncharacterized protein n=1 Tax=Calothrix parasitica NIES-267 TaxID=1973488 RepID=A0A1Z4M2Y3_9CYAN|nr:hypothetical protein NIES267_73770 [Calothrix parasitica NIES-267]
MKISERVRSILSVTLLVSTTTLAQVGSTADMEAYAKDKKVKSPISKVCPPIGSNKKPGRYSATAGRARKAEIKKIEEQGGAKPNRFYTKPGYIQKVLPDAKTIVNTGFEKAGINEVCIPKEGYNQISAARNDFAQELAKLERVVRDYEARLRRMKLSPNKQGREEIVRETMRYFDTKILPRMKQLRAAEIAADEVHKGWSWMWDTGNYSRLYNRYNSAQQVSEVYFEYLRERLRIGTELRLRVKGSNTIPYSVLYAYKGSIKKVHILHQKYKTGEFVLAVAKYEFHKDAYGANTLMDISKRLLKPSYLPNVNYRDNDQVPQPLASQSVNLIFGGKDNRDSAKLERQMKEELEVEFRKNVSGVLAKIAEDGMAALQKQGYHLSNNRYFVLSAVFEFLIFDVGLLDDITKARLASKADDIKKFHPKKGGSSIADDVDNVRNRRRRTNNVPCASNASVGMPIIAGVNNGEVLIASSALSNYSGYSGVVSDVGGGFILAAKRCYTTAQHKGKRYENLDKIQRATILEEGGDLIITDRSRFGKAVGRRADFATSSLDAAEKLVSKRLKANIARLDWDVPAGSVQVIDDVTFTKVSERPPKGVGKSTPDHATFDFVNKAGEKGRLSFHPRGHIMPGDYNTMQPHFNLDFTTPFKDVDGFLESPTKSHITYPEN